MKTYLFEIGDGEGRQIGVVVHSSTYYATDLLDAIAQAKSLVRKRTADPRENTVRISEAETFLAWAPSVEFLRHG